MLLQLRELLRLMQTPKNQVNLVSLLYSSCRSTLINPAFPLQHDSPMYDLSSAPKDAAAGMQTETFIRTTNLLPGGIESLQGTPTGGTETDNNLGDVDMDAKIQPTFFSKHLGQPIIIPQPMLDNDNTDWIKYHIGALEGCGIDRETVLGFALAFDKARKVSASSTSFHQTIYQNDIVTLAIQGISRLESREHWGICICLRV